MTINIKNIHSLSDFQRNTREYVNQLKESHQPVVLTVNGEAALVIQNAAAYQEVLDELEIARSANIVKQRMEKFAQDGIELDAKAALKKLGEDLGIQGTPVKVSVCTNKIAQRPTKK